MHATTHSGPPPVHLHRLTLGQLRTTLACAKRVFLDSDRTEDILIAEEILAQGQLRFLLSIDALGTGDASLLRGRPEFAGIELDDLAELPQDTLGGALAAFYREYQLTTSLYSAQAENTAGDDAAYLMRRIWQVHDLWHVLMNFTTRGHDEILIHAFSLAQTGFPGSVVLVLLGSLKHMLAEARWNCLRRGIREAYRRGRDADRLLGVRWEDHLEEPLDAVRARYGIRPWSDEDHAAMEPWVWSARAGRRLGIRSRA